jgi:hypothetical protein
MEECHEHFVEKILNKSCHHHPVEASPRKHKTPTTAERMFFKFYHIENQF